MLTDVDVATMTAKFETADDVKADVLNVIPPQRAGAIAAQAGVITANNRWCEVDFLTFESIKVPKIHVLGDAIQIAPLMPKSGHMANQHAKVAAAAILNAFAGQAAQSDAGAQQHLLQLHHRQGRRARVLGAPVRPEKKTFAAVPGLADCRRRPSAVEGEYAFAWAKNIWARAMLT